MPRGWPVSAARRTRAVLIAAATAALVVGVALEPGRAHARGASDVGRGRARAPRRPERGGQRGRHLAAALLAAGIALGARGARTRAARDMRP